MWWPSPLSYVAGFGTHHESSQGSLDFVTGAHHHFGDLPAIGSPLAQVKGSPFGRVGASNSDAAGGRLMAGRPRRIRGQHGVHYPAVGSDARRFLGCLLPNNDVKSNLSGLVL